MYKRQTLGVVLPSFFIILLIAAVLKNLMKYAGVEAFLSGVRPCVAVSYTHLDVYKRQAKMDVYLKELGL